MGSFVDNLVGSFSTGAGGNPTVVMMEAAFARHGLPWRYINCEVPANDLADAVGGARAMGWQGFNCSIPHKRAVIALLDDLGESARLCQAVNCVVRVESDSESESGSDDDGHRWVGHNTDGIGFLRSLRGVTDPEGRSVLVIGSGGAAHAIAVELALAGASRISIASRNSATAGSLAELVNIAAPGVGAIAPWVVAESSTGHESSAPVPNVRVEADVDVVVQATPVGMAPNATDVISVDWSFAQTGVVAADVVVNPPMTRFLSTAAEHDAVILDGTGMLVNQAAENIKHWTGLEADTAVLRRALEATF